MTPLSGSVPASDVILMAFLKWDWVIRVEDYQGQPSWGEVSVSDMEGGIKKAKARTGPAFIIRCPDRPRSKHGHPQEERRPRRIRDQKSIRKIGIAEPVAGKRPCQGFHGPCAVQ